MIRISAAALAIVGALGLSACGGASSEFEGKMTQACVEGGEPQASCACQAKMINGALNDKERTMLLKGMEAQKSGGDPQSALTASGMTEADAMAMMQKVMPVSLKAMAECGSK